MAGGDAPLHTGVWWDLNTCPVPAGVDPRGVRWCIESELLKQIGRPSAFSIYAMGNLEYISRDLLETIASSGIVLIHAPRSGKDLCNFLFEWSENTTPSGGDRFIMVISGDMRMVNAPLLRIFKKFTTFCAFPKDASQLATLPQLRHDKVLAKEFVWETLLTDHFDEFVWQVLLRDDDDSDSENTCDMTNAEPLCICDTCDALYEVCEEFITHLKTEEHREESFAILPLDSDGNTMHVCQVCNYPAYDEHNLLIHSQSEEHNRNLKKPVEKEAQEEDCENPKRAAELDLFNEIKKKQSLDRGNTDDAS